MKIFYIGLHEETLHLIKENLLLPGISYNSIAEEKVSASLYEIEKAEILLVGEQTNNPIQITQQVYAHDPNLSIVLINESQNYQKIRQSLLFTPFIGSTVHCVSNAAGKGLADVVKDHMQRTQQRRSYKKFQNTLHYKPVPGANKVERVKTEYLSRVLEEAPVGLVLLNKKGTILSFNKYASSLFSKAEREVLGTSLATLLPENLQQEFARIFNDSPQENLSKVMEISKDGSSRYLEITFSEVDKDNPSYKVALVNDITDQVLIQKTIEESAQKVKMIVESMPEMAWTTGPDGKIDYLNKRWYDYSGQKPGEAYRKNWEKVIHPADLPKVRSSWKTALRKGASYQVECRYLRAFDRTYIWHLTRAVPVRSAAGEILHWVGTCTNIQVLKNTENELQQTAEELAASNEELTAANEEITASNEELHETNELLMKVNMDLDNFVYTASHDLKSPITNIEGLVKILTKKINEKGNIHADLNRILGMINTSISRFQRTIGDLTEIVKLQRLAELETEPIIILTVIDEVKQDLTPQLQEAKAVFEIQMERNSSVYFSRKNLKSILHNLLSNAIKYRSPDRTPLIKVSFSEEGEFQVLSVKDNGLGMNVKDLNKVFGMFQRMHAHVEGTGIGLYIVKRIIENAGGSIMVESSPGKGADFRVSFPKKRPE